MNHLAHTVLAGPHPLHVVGSLLGDHWRGAPDPDWPAELGVGVRLHRRIDGWVDAHPESVAARALFEPPFRRYAGILLDVWFDHLLARDFEQLAAMPLEQHTARAYEALARHDAAWPDPFRMFAQRLVRHRGLEAYRTLDTVEFVLERIGDRLARANPLARALPVLEALGPELAPRFQRLWPQLVAFSDVERKRLATADPS